MTAYPIVSANTTRDDILAVLKEWLPGTVAHVTSLEGGDPAAVDLPHPTRGWRAPATLADLFKADLPLVTVAILDADLERSASEVHAAYTVQVRCWVRGSDYEDTATIASRYAAAIAAVLDWIQPGTSCQVTAVSFDLVTGDTNTRVVGEVAVDALVHQACLYDRHDRPAEPFALPYTPPADGPTVTTTNVNAQREE